MLRNLIAAIVTICLGTACLGPTAPARAQDLVLDKVVTLMRHGVRPPTESGELKHYTHKTWPDWPVADGQLTPHGAEAIARLGSWERGYYARAGLLAAAGCPAQGEVFTWANRGYARTIDTGKAMLGAMFPGCGLAVGVAPGTGHDPLFTARQTPVGRMDPDKAKAAILAKMGGSFAQPRAELAAMLPQLQTILDCCGEHVCPKAAKSCSLGDLDWEIATSKDGGNVDFKGPLNIGATMAQVFLLEYLEGMPHDRRAWGQAKDRSDIVALSAIRLLKYRYMEGVPYIAQHGASNIARQITIALEQGAGIANADSDQGPPPAKLVLFVGSDTQIAELATLLGTGWTARDYLDDETPPGGGLSFELLHDAAGKRYVRALFIAQTPDQIRNASGLDDGNPPIRTDVVPAFCRSVMVAGACPVEIFAAGLRGQIDMSAVSKPAWRD